MIGDDTRLTGGFEIRDDETACKAIDQGLARVYGDRVYWIDGCDEMDLIDDDDAEDAMLDEHQQARMARKNGGCDEQ